MRRMNENLVSRFVSLIVLLLVTATTQAELLNQARVYETAHSGIQWPGLTTWYETQQAACAAHGAAWEAYLCSGHPDCRRHTYKWLPEEIGVREAPVCQIYLEGDAYSHWGYEGRDLDTPDPKNGGCPKVGAGNPCNVATGEKYEFQEDYRHPSGFLTITRHYNSELARQSADIGIGVGWVFGFVSNLDVATTDIRYHDGSGRTFRFNFTGNVWQSDADVRLNLVQDASGYMLASVDGRVERFNSTGQLVSKTNSAGQTVSYLYTTDSLRLDRIVDPYGNTLTFGYDPYGSLATVTDPSGQTIRYDYVRVGALSNRNLTQVTYPDNTAVLYHYENSDPITNGAGTIYYANQLTGISYVDSLGTATRYSTYHYNTVTGKADSTEHANATERFSLSYDSAAQTTVRDAINNAEVMTFQNNLGTRNLISKTNQADGKILTQTFDGNNNLACKKDEEGKITTYSYNVTNQKISTTEGLVGTCANPQTTVATRTISYSYVSATLDLPTQIISPSVVSGQSKITTIQYADGAHPNLPTRINQSGYSSTGNAISRSVALAYNSTGQVTQIDGPRVDLNDVTTLAYNDCANGGGCGQLHSITNALGQVTTFDNYDANGRLLQATDPNGTRANYTYDPRGRISSVTQASLSSAARITNYTYAPAGDVASVSFPDGRTLTYTYDAARLLRQITDNAGNQVRYNYDQKGNRVQEYTYDPSGALVRQIDLAFDARNHVNQINTAGSITQQVYDAVGNLLQETDSNNNPPTTNSFDALNRLVQSINALGGNTNTSYDANNNPTQVIAPNGAGTQYVYDDLGNLLREISADRGSIVYTYDEAGNVRTITDARSVTTTYTYDALNRVTGIGYPNSAENISFNYDNGTNCNFGIGRLCRVQDESGITEYGYDAFGNVVAQIKTESNRTYTTRYTYDPADRIQSMTYPDGRVLTYVRNSVGRIFSINTTVNGSAQTIVSNRTYRADGLVLSQIFGNGLSENRQYDSQGRLTGQAIGNADNRLYTYDPNGNLTQEQGISQSATYNYDGLDRLTQENLSIAGATTPAITTFGYDSNGNRVSQNLPNGAAPAYIYQPNSNRLIQRGNLTISVDPAGNTVNDRSGARTFLYNNAGRLIQVSINGVIRGTYTYNYQGQRTRKIRTSATGNTANFIYHYDINGNVIAETRPNGNLVRLYVWADQEPVAQIQNKASLSTEELSYLHTDNLGSPRLATNQTRTVIWRCDSESFGTGRPDNDPDADETITNVRLRLPGQYADGESGLYYNWNRYYDPKIGRYITSDPIGLEGGLNTYAYVDNNPLRWIDPEGLEGFDPTGPGGALADPSQPEPGLDPMRLECLLPAMRGLCGLVSKTETVCEMAEHTKNKRKSSEEKHEKGQSRKQRDQGNEKGDKKRDYYGNKRNR